MVNCDVVTRDQMLKLMALVGGCLVMSSSLHAQEVAERLPVLLVRGIACRDQIMRPIESALKENGFGEIDFASHESYFGEDSIKDVALEIDKAAKRLLTKTNAKKIDIVAFSMGALSARYVIQRMSGKEYVHKFVSISGPHYGTYTAFLPQLFSGIDDMRPDSEIIADLNSDENPWGDVLVYSFYTPYDLIIFPGSNGILPKSIEVKSFQVAFHHQMVKHKDVLADVVRVLKE